MAIPGGKPIVTRIANTDRAKVNQDTGMVRAAIATKSLRASIKTNTPSLLIQKHRFSKYLTDLRTVLVGIVKLHHIDTLLPVHDRADRNMSILAALKRNHPARHPLGYEIHRHIGIIKRNHQIKRIRGS